ncbi:hypothetical protein HRI_004441200 [Hibiscus trionum]|uniref:Uncharacterized protein n=1 Tax=Hibiscus trionum TaxID=183268 RepID=A0A9W7MQD4_HIBTR|nr:hypothetical protein HRI_004441200 [Hibiscus trionum]
MLLRSSSTPILCIPQSSVADSGHRSSSKAITVTASSHNMMQRTPSDGNMRQTAIPKRHSPLISSRSFSAQESVKEEGTDNVGSRKLSLAGGDVGSNGGGAAQGFGEYGEGKEVIDDYYQHMIKTYPGETLLLANYAKFLKEVQGDLVKAEEYCERAVLMKPNDGEVLSMYGDLIWTNHRDEARAQSYFDRALQASPDDCHVIASYAWYLWNAEEEEEEEEVKGEEHPINGANTCTPQQPHGRFPHGPPCNFTTAAC